MKYYTPEETFGKRVRYKYELNSKMYYIFTRISSRGGLIGKRFKSAFTGDCILGSSFNKKEWCLVESGYHVCTLICKECMKNPREAILL